MLSLTVCTPCSCFGTPFLGGYCLSQGKTRAFILNPISGMSCSWFHLLFAVILLPLCPASLMHRNPQRLKTIQRLIDRITCVFVEISHSCNFCGSYYGSCLTMHISFSLCCAFKKKDYILISVYCNTEFWSCLSSD